MRTGIHLTAWIANFKKPPKKVFIVHGEETTAVEFAEHVKNDVDLMLCSLQWGCI